jgi:hypothetical protein
MSGVDVGWAAYKERCGQEMHAGWKQQEIAAGFADHPHIVRLPIGDDRCRVCGLLPDRHHDDMIQWDALLPEQRARVCQRGEIPFRIGYEAGKAAR